MSTVKRGQTIELDIEKFADKGKSLARVDGYVVFVRGAVPGDRIKAYIYKTKKSYAEAALDELIEPSDLRTEPRCRYADTCGGCSWQHVDYDAQLDAKRQSVEEAFQHQGGFEGIEVPPTLGADHIYYYRNKMDFDFSADRWLTSDEIDTGKAFDTDFALGLHVPGNFFKVLDLQECHLQSVWSADFVNALRDFVKTREWAPWDIRDQEGFLRHLVIRIGERTGDVMVDLVTNGFEPERMEALSAFIQSDFPEVTTFINTIHTGKSQNPEGEPRVIFGPGVIYDEIGPCRFEISPQAFFQTNTRQAETLYEVARDYAELEPSDVLYDLYCGAGTIGIFMADRVERVVGVEMIEEAVANAQTNAQINNADNCTFAQGDLKQVFTPDFVEQHGRPDVLIVDPPRAGMHKDVIQQIAELRPERFVYVSCNPQTQARDLDRLREVYRIEAMQPVDMFPHTPHIENVVKLRAREA